MPAIIILGHFSPQIQAAHGFAGPELLHNVAAQFYDVPHIRYVSSSCLSLPIPILHLHRPLLQALTTFTPLQRFPIIPTYLRPAPH